MHNRTGPTNAHTSGPHLPALSYATHARLTYQSSACAIGTHSECAQSSPATAPVGVPVIYEACACSCHTPDEPSNPRQANQ
ncbi:hypothetical protein ACFWIB_33700 [Streptomyces sp. NPDC127051]|uniref:hypothetical protein n=1 Tax=Streptomyces sp. NPDC127051 TaxID=3347119 RepID=UPI00365C05CF